MFTILEKLIKKKKISIYYLAQQTGITATSFSDWKAGRAKPSVKALEKLADFFGVTIDYLLGRKTKKTKEV